MSTHHASCRDELGSFGETFGGLYNEIASRWQVCRCATRAIHVACPSLLAQLPDPLKKALSTLLRAFVLGRRRLLFDVTRGVETRDHLDVHAVGETQRDFTLLEFLRRDLDLDEGLAIFELGETFVDGKHLVATVEDDVRV